MTPLEAIVNFRKALWELSQQMGALEFYDEDGNIIVSSEWTNADGESLWASSRAEGRPQVKDVLSLSGGG